MRDWGNENDRYANSKVLEFFPGAFVPFIQEFQNFRRSIIFPGLSRESSKFGAPNVFFPQPCDFVGKKVSLKNGHLLETG